MKILNKVIGRDGLHRSRLHDEKGNQIPAGQIHEIFAAAALRISTSLIDRPYLPWVPFKVINELTNILNKQSHVLEFGSGRSTVWYARKSLSVTSIEDNTAWSEKMSFIFKKLRIDNVDYRLLTGSAYFNTVGFSDAYFDLVVVDGSHRANCVESAHTKLKRGGYLYLDNSDKDMTDPKGDMRIAERTLLKLAEEWSSTPRYFLGYPPGNLFPHQGVLLKKT
jgi:hypothetical protein